jgi:hypothetical protein
LHWKFVFKIALVFWLFSSFLGPLGIAGEGRWEEPWPSADPNFRVGGGKASLDDPSAGQKVTQGFIRFFIKYISPVDGDRCPCYPTCSQYAQEAVREHGVLVGLVMTFDRLIHEADEIHRAPTIRVYDSYRVYDPVKNNDFWWDKSSNQHSAVSRNKKRELSPKAAFGNMFQ